jgi:copper homeostasis protein
MSILLEIAVDTLHDAAAAQYGGADRIELCLALDEDGLSPSEDLVRAVRAAVTIPIHAMVRPRAGDFCYSHEEFERMKSEIALFKSLGVNGIVLGILHADRSVDQTRTAELIRLAQPLGVTFHRAFDAAIDPFGSLERIIASGAKRLLTSGQQPTAPEGIALIGQLIEAARGRITIMPGAGINKATIGAFTSTNGIEEVHVGKGVKSKNSSGDLFVDQKLVKNLLLR